MKKKKSIMFIIIIIMLLITLLIAVCFMKNDKLIYYNFRYLNTSHGTPRMDEYKIYSSGKIEKYSHGELIIKTRISVDELKGLEDLIISIENNFKKKDINEEKGFQINGTYISQRYIYGKSNNKISLYDIEAEKLEEILKYTKDLEEKYCSDI